MRRARESSSGDSDIDCNTPKPARTAQKMATRPDKNVPEKAPERNINDVYRPLENTQKEQEEGRKL